MSDNNLNLTALPNGTTLQNGNYTIIEKIGEGGFGITYRARQNNLNREVCIKEYFLAGRCLRNTMSREIFFQGDNTALFEKYRQGFVNEAEMVASLSHPHIVEIIGIFGENNTSYMVMPFIKGGSLESIVKRQGPLPFATTMNYLAQIAEAVDYIHARNILHRDIKPSNIMITEDFRAILIDFGSAREFVNDKTQAHTSILTQGYAPPEQYSTVSRKGNYSDIYSLGATFYFALTGYDPVDSAARLTEPLPEPRKLNPAIPEHVNRAILKAMQMDPKGRQQTVQEFMHDLNEEHSSNERQQEVQKNKKMLLYVLIPLLALLLAGGVVLLVRSSSNQESSSALPASFDKIMLYGNIGSDYNAYLEFSNTTVTMSHGVAVNGYYRFLDATRDVGISEYNPETGRLVINAYWQNDGGYVGQFNGMLVRDQEDLRYEGTFTNYKGQSIPFSLSTRNRTSPSATSNATVAKEEVKTAQAQPATDKAAAIGVNAYIYDSDGDYTNIRSGPNGTVVDQLPCAQGRYGLKVDRQENGWWHISGKQVYDALNNTVISLKANDGWIHHTRLRFTN